MVAHRRYFGDSVPTALRLSKEERRIVEWLTLTTGAESMSSYLRQVIEEHLAGLGFPVTPGVTRQLPLPDPLTIAAYMAVRSVDE